MSTLRALAPAKVNLGLFLGPARELDGRHELVTVMQSISLADELTLEQAGALVGAQDEVLCPGAPQLAGPGNLAARALAAFRAASGWNAPAQRLTIHKRIPVAAGLGGGSADAAAALRLAARASGLGDERMLAELAAGLGADVPAQVAPGRWLATGAGERLGALPAPASAFSLLVLPLADELSTADVYREADRLALGRSMPELGRLAAEVRDALGHGAPLPAARELLHNDLQRAAVSLCPRIVDALGEARRAGAELAFVSGSGPTVVGVFAGSRHAEAAAASLVDRLPRAHGAVPVDAAFAAPVALD